MTLEGLTSQGCNNFQLFHLGKITRNYYTPNMLSFNISNYLIKRQSERYIIIEIIKLRLLSFKLNITCNPSSIQVLCRNVQCSRHRMRLKLTLTILLLQEMTKGDTTNPYHRCICISRTKEVVY